ncbi:MAG: hypothetical protein AAFP19_22585 [Bacteroidota bacterium]
MSKSNHNCLTNIIITLVGIPAILVVAFCTWGLNNYVFGHDREEYLIPNHFIGKLLIIHNQADGLDKEYKEPRNRIYRFSKDGALKTQFDINPGGFGKNDRKFFCVNENDEKINEKDTSPKLQKK